MCFSVATEDSDWDSTGEHEECVKGEHERTQEEDFSREFVDGLEVE